MRQNCKGSQSRRCSHYPKGNRGSASDPDCSGKAHADSGGGNGSGLFGSVDGSVHAGRRHITTIEKYQPRIVAAKENFRLAGMEDAITLMEGDADKVLEQLSGTFDFIFMDAAKGQYIHWLPRILELMAEGALLVTDNVLQDGDVAESRFAVERRNRTIHARMRDYLYTLTHMEELKTSIVPIGDGVALSVKILRREP